ncbi:lycopene beta-cyclase CrtY [Enterovirga aerilata]|uniref:Lycopene beta-cyclase CrtY n=1 Tax=Enterovirga aerilata TaxID=2730920 RepID=A0A849I9M0_9HYPH|nr:lycopene beta-cyclase CrtY [Enterovirga sp. DB1703]NNM72697.1 lycopene beta-cyclase CrtY [Enterovirga sp. DB1703]
MIGTGLDHDLILVGGGLANGLIAYRLAQLRPERRVLVLEGGDRLGGNHTWSFHATDLSDEEAAWLDPFVVHRWPAYDVVFPERRRRVGIGYRSVTSDRFHDVLIGTLARAVRLRSEVAEIAPTRVLLAGGECRSAAAVIDGRGAAPTPHMTFAWQKFVGLELRLREPHGLTVPILMDATVPQQDGYRFVYVLPFGPDTALVEDTYYADGPDLDDAVLRDRILSYVAGKGWSVAEVLREERGVLPITLGGDIEAFWRGPEVPRSGLRAGLFHPVTGYSLPDAVRLADHIAGLPDLSAASLHSAVRTWSQARWRGHGFFRLLNRMLFRAGKPQERYRMLQRFYGLPEPTIGRFYAGRPTAADKARLFVGRPPVPVLGAARVALNLAEPAR